MDILDAYDIKEHNQDGKYDIYYGEIAGGNIVNIAYQVNIGKKLPQEVDYHTFLKKKGDDYYSNSSVTIKLVYNAES